MSYINAIKRKDDVLVWERVDGKRIFKMYDAPYYFYSKSEDGTYISMYDDKLERHDFNTGREFNEGRSRIAAFGTELFESDIPIELKILSQKYYEADLPKLNTTLFDIEVDYDPRIGYSSMENPYAPISSIAYYNNWQNRMVVIAVPPPEYKGTVEEAELLKELDIIAKIPTDVEIEIKLFDNEKEMLIYFLDEIEDSDLLSGWNSEGYDIPMLGKRLEMMGHKYFSRLSFNEGNDPKWKEEEIFDKKVITLSISGRVSLDYMLIFKKFEVTNRPSYSLENISDEILIDGETKEPILPKLEYTGSLADLYHKNFVNFLRYNLRDTEVLLGFERVLGYVELANIFVHQSTGLFKHVTGTIKLSELATINHCHYNLNGTIVNDTHPPDSAEKAKGAFVLIPQVGEHDQIGSVDINSLYPSTIRSNNISPEMIVGQFQEDIRAFEEIRKESYVQLTLKMDSGEKLVASASEWREALIAKCWGISGYGTVFSLKKQGIMPAILEGWYNTRKEFQAKMIEAKESGDKAKALYYKKIQHVYKIKLNSYYGSLLNAYFRFYDKRMGESTTATSREILLHQCAKVTELLDGKYLMPDKEVYDPKKDVTHIGYSDKWSVIYGDTDSSYFVTHGESVEQATLIADTIGDKITESFPEFMRDAFLCTEGFDNIIKTGREIIADKGIFVDKKRYMLHVVDNEGFKCDDLKVMGLETKKTAMPKFIAIKINAWMKRYLTGDNWDDIAIEIVDFKDELQASTDYMKLGITVGIQNVEKYTAAYATDSTCFLPGHVAGAILFNECLKKYNDTESLPIISGVKIKKFMLNKEIGRFKAISIPADLETIPEWFIEHFGMNYDEQILRLVDKPLTNIIKAIGKESPSKQSLSTDSLLGF